MGTRAAAAVSATAVAVAVVSTEATAITAKILEPIPTLVYQAFHSDSSIFLRFFFLLSFTSRNAE